MRVALILLFAVGCTFAPIDHEGQRAPCLPGYVEDAGRCYRGSDDTCSALACDGNEIIACDGSRATCADGCEESPRPHCHFDRSYGVETADDADAALEPFVVPLGMIFELDTDTGRIVSIGEDADAGSGEVRTSGVGPIDHIVFQRPGGGSIGAIHASSIAIHGTLRARGTAALALIAQTEIVIDGTLDVSADGPTPGAGGGEGGPTDRRNCTPAPAIGAGTGGNAHDSNYYGPGGGGGGGGSEGARGGDTSPTGCTGAPTAPGEGGAAALDVATLRGGFGGGTGGDDREEAIDDVAARGGAGGGAVLLSAGVRIHLAGSGTIDACGGGGEGGGALGGGGGGGAGGLVVLEAPIIARDTASVIGANGGAGAASGVDQCDVDDGFACMPAAAAAQDGADGEARITSGAPGGVSQRETYGTSGGDGSDSRGVADAPTGRGRFNGGGGGGGAGLIVLRGMSMGSGILSPEMAPLVMRMPL